MPHISIIKYIVQRSGSVIVCGTSPVKTSLHTNLLKIAFPFRGFSSPYFSCFDYLANVLEIFPYLLHVVQPELVVWDEILNMQLTPHYREGMIKPL
jgi:hypothetical protein